MDPIEQIIEHLQASKFGRVLRAEQIRQLASIAVVETYDSGVPLFREGSAADALWVICSGEVEIRMTDHLQDDTAILHLKASDIMGWSALVGDGKMSASAVINRKSTVIRMPAESLKDLCLADHTLGYAVMGTVAFAVATRLEATRRQLINLSTSHDARIPLAVQFRASKANVGSI